MIPPKDPLREAMNEWQDMQKQPDTGMRDLLKRKKAKPRKLSELS